MAAGAGISWIAVIANLNMLAQVAFSGFAVKDLGCM